MIRWLCTLVCTWALLSTSPPAAQAESRRQPPRSTAPDSLHVPVSPRSPAYRTCRYVMNELARSMRQLLKAADISSAAKTAFKPHQQPWQQLLALPTGSCHRTSLQPKIIKLAAQVRATHQQKIGVIVPASGLEEYLKRAFFYGLTSACQQGSIPCEPRRHLVVRSYNPLAAGDLQRALGELIYTHGVSVIIGGFSTAHHRLLSQIGALFAIPIFLMAPGPDDAPPSNHVFQHSPSERLLLARLMDHFRTNNLHQIVLLEPASAQGRLHQEFTAMAPAYGVKLAAYHTYDQHYRSIIEVSEEVLQLRPHHRQEEWATLVKAQQQAQEVADAPITAAEVFLEPQFNYDAIMIADNAKMVRHFAKIFRYLRLKRPLPLVGMHLWRTQELITPWDPLLEGAYFADFISNYTTLPSFIRPFDETSTTSTPAQQVATTHNGYFTAPALMAAVDLQLLGYRAANLAMNLITRPGMKRSQLSKHIRRTLHHEASAYPTSLPRHPHEVPWPTYLFKISGGKINQQPPPAMKALAHQLPRSSS